MVINDTGIYGRGGGGGVGSLLAAMVHMTRKYTVKKYWNLCLKSRHSIRIRLQQELLSEREGEKKKKIRVCETLRTILYLVSSIQISTIESIRR